MAETAERYVIRENTPPIKGLESYAYVVWDTEENKPIAYTGGIFAAKDYAGQMNEKGFIEP
jgi:hypothetical protein